MDPTAALRFLLDALASQNAANACESLGDLQSWLSVNGFFPDVRRVVREFTADNYPAGA